MWCVVCAGPPEISLPESVAELIVAGNTLVEIECPFRSYPLPEVRWFKLAQEGEQEEINSLSERFTYVERVWSTGTRLLPQWDPHAPFTCLSLPLLFSLPPAFSSLLSPIPPLLSRLSLLSISSNGSLFIMGVSQVHAFNYLCLLSNTFGSDNRTFHLRVVGTYLTIQYKLLCI